MATAIKTVRAVNLDIPIKENTEGTETLIKSVVEYEIDGEHVFNTFGTILRDKKGPLGWDFTSRVSEEEATMFIAKGTRKEV